MRQTIIFLIMAVALTACSGKGVNYSPGEIERFDPEVRESIINSEVFVGMPQDAVRFSWGQPDEVSALGKDAEGRNKEEWVYKNLPNSSRLIFLDGTLHSVRFRKGR